MTNLLMLTLNLTVISISIFNTYFYFIVSLSYVFVFSCHRYSEKSLNICFISSHIHRTRLLFIFIPWHSYASHFSLNNNVDYLVIYIMYILIVYDLSNVLLGLNTLLFLLVCIIEIQNNLI